MEGIKIVIFALVMLGWLAIWIIRIFRKAFNQPAANHKKPFVPKPNVSVKEIIRQHQPKSEEDFLERYGPPVARTLEVQEPIRRSLETLKPMGRPQDTILGETVAQRKDIIRQRKEKNIYQINEKKPVSVFAKMLRNPENARNAVVLAEILKRKF